MQSYVEEDYDVLVVGAGQAVKLHLRLQDLV